MRARSKIIMTRKQLVDSIFQHQSFLSVGLDTDAEKLPAGLPRSKKGILEFNKRVIDATTPYCVSYKLNTAFYEARGVEGWEILEETLAMIPSSHFAIADAKRADIGNTSAQYAKTFFDTLGFDAVTVAPYMGADSLLPFLNYSEKFTIVLGLTSNSGSKDFQQLTCSNRYLYEHVIEQVSRWGTPDNLMFVAGATKAGELKRIRTLVPENFLLVPGVGAQGGSLTEVADNAMTADCGLLVNASRSVIYASSGNDFEVAAANAAQLLQQEMSAFLNRPS